MWHKQPVNIDNKTLNLNPLRQVATQTQTICIYTLGYRSDFIVETSDIW